MPTVEAWQQIYGNVEKEQSPRGRGGFQTLFYTQTGLTEAELSEAEERLLYFPSEVTPIKRLFFTLSGGKVVVAQIHHLPRPDQFGRGGRYLAHSLIFAPESLPLFEAAPFWLFRQFDFVSTVEEALERGDSATGDIPPARLELPDRPAHELEAARHWPVAEYKKLALLALRVEQQRRERNAIIFAGSPAQIEAALEAAFLPVPLSLRPDCSFDTYFYRCNLVATYFWAIGLPEPPARVKFALVQAEAPQLRGNIPAGPETAYERWVWAVLDDGRLAEIPAQRESAFALAEWLDGRQYAQQPFEAASPQLVEAVLVANPQPVRETLHRRVEQNLPPALAERTAEQLYRQAEPTDLYRYLRQGVALPQLLDSLAESYAAQQWQKPPRPETKALANILEQSPHPLLTIFLAYWTQSRRHFLDALARLEAADYRRFVEIALRLNLVEPLDLLIPGRSEPFLALYRPENMAELVERLIEIEEVACLDRLSEEVSALSGPELGRIIKLIEGRSDTPESFRAAVAEASEALPPPGGIRGVVGKLWRGLKGDHDSD